MQEFIFEMQRFDATISGSTDFEITAGGVYTIESGYTGTIKINTAAAVTVDGSNAGELSKANILVEVDAADLTIKDLKFNFSSYHSNPIKFGDGAGNKLTILGDNSFNLNSNDIGINIGGGLEITDSSTGTLTVNSSSFYTPCIGASSKTASSADIVINGGIINVATNGYAAGIGSGTYGSMGNIVINRGTITAIGKYGAGIGCSTNATVSNVEINGGTIHSTSEFGAGIGSGYGGQGGIDSKASSVDFIKITGGDITATSKKGAGIGTGDGYSSSEGFGSTVGEILISGGKIIASGTGGEGSSSVIRTSGAGIGSGYRGTVGNITINGTADIEATSTDGAGIGTAFAQLSPPYTSVGDIIIGGQAKVTASSQNNGAGIGTGEVHYVGQAETGNITITDNAVVTATSGGQGAGIGGGYTERGKVNSEKHSTSTVGNISIDGDVTVTATNSESGVGIGAGNKDNDSINTVGTIILSGDTSTSVKSTVTINNGDTEKALTINGKTFSGKQLIFEDGNSTSSESGSESGGDTTAKADYKIVVSETGQVMLQEDGVIKVSETIYKTVFGENTTTKPTDGVLPNYPVAGLQLSSNLGSKSIALENNFSSAITLKDSTGKNIISNLAEGGEVVFSNGNVVIDSVTNVQGVVVSLAVGKTLTLDVNNVVKADKAGSVTVNATDFVLSASDYTINGVKVTVPANTLVDFVADGVKVTLTENALTYNSMKLTGNNSTAEIISSKITLSDATVVTNAKNNQAFTISGTVKFDEKTIVTAKISTDIVNTSTGIKIGDNALNISGDDKYTVNIDAEGKISSVEGLGASGGVTVTGAGGATQIFTDKAGAIKFTEDGGKIFTTSGDDSVTFGLTNAGIVEKISELSGTVTGNFANGIAVDNKAVKITGDTSVQVSAADNAVTEISGLGKNSVVESAGGADKVVTDEVGKFTFGTSDSTQIFAIGNDTQVAFTMTDKTVSGIESLTSGTFELTGTNTDFKVNNAELIISKNDTVTLNFDEIGLINKVANLKDSISGLTGNVTVNVADVDVVINDSILKISDPDLKYDAILSDGEISSITGVGKNSSVSVAKNLSVVTSSQGSFIFGEDVYSISGDNSVTFETDDDSKVKNISNFVGSLKSSAKTVTVNGAEFETSNTDAVILSTGEGISGVNNLKSSDTIII